MLSLTDEEASRCARGQQRPAEWLQARIDSSICVDYGQSEFKNQFSTTDGRVIRQFVVDSGTTNVRCALCDWKPTQDRLNLRSGPGWNTLLNALRTHCGQSKQGNGERAPKQHMEHVLSVAAAPTAVSSTPLAPPPPAVVEVAAAPLLQRVAAPAEAAPALARRGRPPAKADHKASRFAGVTWDPYKGGKWRAAIMVQGHTIPLGDFDVEEDAARAYDAAQSQWGTLIRGDRARINFPGEAPLASALAALPPLPAALQPPASLPPRRRSAPPTAQPPPPGSRVAVRFKDGIEYAGTVEKVEDANHAFVRYDDGQSETVRFPDPDVRVTGFGPEAPAAKPAAKPRAKPPRAARAAPTPAAPEQPAAKKPRTAPQPCLLYTSPSPRDKRQSRMPSSA